MKKCNKHKQDNRQDRDGENAILSCLWDRPLTIDEIIDQFAGMLRRFGVFDHQLAHWFKDEENLDEFVGKHIPDLIKKGLIEQKDQVYDLTQSGRYEASIAIKEIQKFSNALLRLSQPRTVSITSLITHLVLGAIKLPAALLSGSIGLLNDSFDTLLDALSNILVSCGVRCKVEKVANSVMVGVMLLTGFYAFYRAMQQFFFPEVLNVNIFAFVAAILSALIYLLLSLYQRFVGLKSGSITLIRQSVDSRNHIFIALGVIVGLVLNLFGFPYIDSLAGFIVAAIILRNAVEMTWELFQQEEEFSPDFERFNMFFSDKVRNWQDRHYNIWLLFLIDSQKLDTREKLIQYCEQSLDFSSNIMLREMGLVKEMDVQDRLSSSLKILKDNGWIDSLDEPALTNQGREQLKAWVS